MSFFNYVEDDQEFDEQFPELGCTSFLSTGRVVSETEFHELPGMRFMSDNDYEEAENRPVEI